MVRCSGVSRGFLALPIALMGFPIAMEELGRTGKKSTRDNTPPPYLRSLGMRRIRLTI